MTDTSKETFEHQCECNLSDRLRASGYAHGPAGYGTHAIFDSQGGLVGYFTAKSAWVHFFPKTWRCVNG